MIHEILVEIVCDQEEEAFGVLDEVADSSGLVVAESSIELLNVDTGDPDADLIDGVLVQARLERHDHRD